MRRLSFTLFGLALFAACTPSPEEIRLSRILIDTPPAYDQDERARENLRERLEQKLLADDTLGGFVPRPKATHSLQVRAHDIVELEDRKVRPVEIRLVSLGQARSFETVGRGGVEGDITQGIEVGFDDAWPVLSTMRWLAVQKSPKLIEALQHEDPRVRGYAVDELGLRKESTSVSPLLSRLKDEPKEDLVLRTVGALVAIGDQAAVEPLIDLTYQKDPSFVLQIVFAVSAIGGRTAEGFLVTLASGHPHPAIQKGAKDALDEMQRKQTAAAQGG